MLKNILSIPSPEIRKVLAFDFGASNGRAILSTFENDSLTYKEVHRFENNPIEQNGHLCWDFENLMKNVYTGIAKAGHFDSIGFDTWGVDFGLLDTDGKLLDNPVHYRDKRTEGIVQKAADAMSEAELYAKTGNQVMQINTLFQLLALKEQQPELLKKAKTLLFMPDLFSYMLTGKPTCELSIASTSQMLDLKSKQWSKEVLDTFDLPKDLLPPPVPSGTIVGEYNGAKVVAVAGHDTQCATVALPKQCSNIAFLSCGTWSLLGTERDTLDLTESSMKAGFSSELGANGKINYLKNMIGLWLIQESRREWRRQGQEYSYSDLERLALAAKPLRCFVDSDAPEFTQPGNIPTRIQEYCHRTGQAIPQTVGEIVRCIYESLAMKYRYAVEQLSDKSNHVFSAIHILGGGTKDGLLCQMTANSCHLPVIAGPVEATALGNIIIQLVAIGVLPNVDAGRELIKNTEVLTHYEPTDKHIWNEAYQVYRRIIL